jgi:hypothetical protein
MPIGQRHYLELGVEFERSGFPLNFTPNAMDLLNDVLSKLEQVRSTQTSNQQELVALKAKIGHLHVGQKGNALPDASR